MHDAQRLIPPLLLLPSSPPFFPVQTCCEDAHSYLETEVECADKAGRMATELLAKLSPSLQSRYEGTRWVLSVGSTPTAHSAGTEEDAKRSELSGDLELRSSFFLFPRRVGALVYAFRFPSSPTPILTLTGLAFVLHLFRRRKFVSVSFSHSFQI